MQSNDLTELLPTELGLMTNLTYMDLGSNRLSSRIPTEIGYLTSLVHFDVRINTMKVSKRKARNDKRQSRQMTL